MNNFYEIELQFLWKLSKLKNEISYIFYINISLDNQYVKLKVKIKAFKIRFKKVSLIKN